MENYLFYEPLRRLKAIVESGEIGAPVGFHMKMVGTGAGGWDVPASTWGWRFDMAREGRGILVFDDGWHKFSVARWLFGPVARVMAWIGRTEFTPEFTMDAPSTIMWQHESGLRGCGTSRSPPTCSCAPTTTRTTNGSRSPARAGSYA